MTTIPKRALALSAIALGGTAVAAAPATAADVTAGALTWTNQALYQTPAGAGTPADPTNRTWLGYVTNSPAPIGASGTATPSDGATGDTVTTASSRTVDDFYSWTYGAARGTYEPADGTGTIEWDGTVTFASPTPPAGHGFRITVEDPQVVLNGDRGVLYASGLNSDRATGSYTRATPLFNLDLSNADVALKANGSRTISGIVPSLATSNSAFPANYAVGAGPDRLPNTFGSFAINLKTTAVSGPKGDKGDAGAKGDKGDKGDSGAAGKNGSTTVIRIHTATLSKAPFSGKAARKVRVTARGKKAVLATGTVKGRKLNVTLAKGKKSLPGVVVLHVVGGKATATVRL